MPLYQNTADWLQANYLTTGQETMSREMVTNGAAATPVSQQLRLGFFTARKGEVTTQIRLYSGTTAAGATPTLVRAGLYLMDSTNGGTLVASIANDTTIFATVTTAYTRSWSASYTLLYGQRYAVGTLVVSAAAMPTYNGSSLALAAESAQAPMLTAILAGQADLPGSFAGASLTTTGARYYAAVLP